MTHEQPTHLDLFSGIGGFALAAQWAGFRTIGFCELDKYCQKVLAKNFKAMADTECEPNGDEGRGETSGTKATMQGEVGQQRVRPDTSQCPCPRISSNIFTLDGTRFRGVSLITGGFPCQPFSVAGKRGGAADERAIWSEMFRVISEARPAWVLGENVPGIISMELDNVLSDLEGIGYATRAFVIGACCVDAKHRRRRVWIVGRNMADTGLVSERWADGPREAEGIGAHSEPSGCSGVPNSLLQGLEGQRKIACGTGTQFNNTGDYCRWLPEPDVGRVAHGVRNRVDRLKGLGNAIVPQVAFEILREIRKLI